MSTFNFLKGLFTSDTGELYSFADFILNQKAEQLRIKELAIEHAIDLIAKTICKCEIKVFRLDSKSKKIKETADDIYYRLNVLANPNEVSTSFFYRVMSKLLHDEEALIIEVDRNLYLADSFEVDEMIMSPKTYSKVIIKDLNDHTFELTSTFNAKDVMHLTLGDSKIKETIDNFYLEYGKLLSISSNVYKILNTRKWRLKIPGQQPTMIDPITKEPISYENYKKKIVEGLFSEEEAIIMLSEAFDLTQLGDIGKHSSEDYRKMVKEWSDSVAMAFNIPLDIFYGTKTDKSTSTNDFITFAVLPNIEILEDNFNAKLIKKEMFLKGERIRINKLNMKHYDIMDAAGPLDKLTGIGFSHNDNRGFLGLNKLDEDWADEHNVTKNYANVKGGDE